MVGFKILEDHIECVDFLYGCRTVSRADGFCSPGYILYLCVLEDVFFGDVESDFTCLCDSVFYADRSQKLNYESRGGDYEDYLWTD